MEMMIAGLDHDIQARRDVYKDSWLDCRDYQRDAWSLACREWKGEEQDILKESLQLKRVPISKASKSQRHTSDLQKPIQEPLKDTDFQ